MHQNNTRQTEEFCALGGGLSRNKTAIKTIDVTLNFCVIITEINFSSLVCRCSKKAAKEGYKLFGIQFWKECWGYKGEATDLATKVKPATNCESRDEVLCKPATDKKVEDKVCTGTYDTSFIYETLGRKLIDLSPREEAK